MRLHRTHVILAPWSIGVPVLDAARLVALRVEPVLRQRKSALLLDLCLAGDGGLTVIPSVLVEPSQVIARERDPLIWPQGIPGDDAFLAALAERVLPHLERIVLSGERVTEHVVEFGDASVFTAARSAGAFGAAPLREALVRLAPYRYAARFTRSRRVRIDAADAVGGWALLRARATVGVPSKRREPALLAWYGDPPDVPASAEVAIVAADAGADEAIVLRLDVDGKHRVDVVDPMPLDVSLSFDLAEGPAARWFSVERALEPASRRSVVPEYRPVGGSAGRIRVLVARGDAAIHPGADTDEAAALVAALQAEGFDALIAANPEELAGAELIHVVGTREGRLARRAVEAGRLARVPVALHAYAEDSHLGGWWGAALTRFCFEYGVGERELERYLDLLAKRALTLDTITALEPYAPAAAAIEDAAAALRDATVVFAASEDEAEAIRRLGRRGPIAVVPPLASIAPRRTAIGHRTGPDPFVLVHAPVGPEQNQLLVARACADAGVPLICAGPIVDASYLERVREFGGADLIVLPEPAGEEAAALVASAAVVVDAAWVGSGGSRLAAAALAGARLAVADRRRFAVEGVDQVRFDPADVRQLTRAIGDAWDAALRRPRTAEVAALTLAPGGVVRQIVRGYASAVAPVA